MLFLTKSAQLTFFDQGYDDEQDYQILFCLASLIPQFTVQLEIIPNAELFIFICGTLWGPVHFLQLTEENVCARFSKNMWMLLLQFLQEVTICEALFWWLGFSNLWY